MGFFDRLKEERERMDLSQESFASVGGVQKRAQINYESGLRKPDIEYLEKLSKIGVDVSYVVTGQRSVELKSTLSSDKEVLLRAYDAAPVAVRNSALAVLLSGGQAPEGVDTSKERKGRAAPKKVKQYVENNQGGKFYSDVKTINIGRKDDKAKD